MRFALSTIALVPRGQPYAPADAAQRRIVFDFAAETGFDALEVSGQWLDFEMADPELRNVRRAIEHRGLTVSGINVDRCLMAGHTGIDNQQQRCQVARLDRALEVAMCLEAPIINVSLSIPSTLQTTKVVTAGDFSLEDEARIVEHVAPFVKRAGRAGVRVVFELHDDGLLDDAAACLHWLEYFDDAAVGINPDLGNRVRQGHGDWRSTLESLAPHTVCWHVKNYRGSTAVPLHEGDIDMADAMERMQAAGFDGFVSIESRLANPLAHQRRGLAFLQSLVSPPLAHAI